MKIELKKEIYIWVLVILPAVYLAFIWNALPEQVPLHWNIHGEIDRYGPKSQLIIILLLPLFIYGLMTVVPFIDPKRKLQNMGNKYFQLKFILVLLLAVISLFVLYNTRNEPAALSFISAPNLICALIGLLFAALGNYFQSIKPNYFIGIRTPWTLESESVWKKTHKLGGILWVAGGLLIIMSSVLLRGQSVFIILLIVTGIITLWPVIYSYVVFKKESRMDAK